MLRASTADAVWRAAAIIWQRELSFSQRTLPASGTQPIALDPRYYMVVRDCSATDGAHPSRVEALNSVPSGSNLLVIPTLILVGSVLLTLAGLTLTTTVMHLLKPVTTPASHPHPLSHINGMSHPLRVQSNGATEKRRAATHGDFTAQWVSFSFIHATSSRIQEIPLFWFAALPFTASPSIAYGHDAISLLSSAHAFVSVQTLTLKRQPVFSFFSKGSLYGAPNGAIF